MLGADELHRRGVALINDGRVRAARRTLLLARERADDPALSARIEASLAYVADELGETAEALALCELALGRPDLGGSVRGSVLAQLGLMQMRSGATHAALATFSEAIGHLLEDPGELGRALINRGGVHLQLGDALSAAQDFSASAVQFGIDHDALNRAKAEHNLGYARLLSADLVGALRAMEEAAVVLAPVSPVLRAICDQDRAEAMLAAGLQREGVELLDRSSRAYGARRLRQRQGEAELAMARRLLLLDPVRARASALSARKRFASVRAQAWLDRAEAVVVGASVELRARDRDLLSRGLMVEHRLREQGLRWPATVVRLYRAVALLRGGALEPAAELLDGIELRGAPLDVRLLAYDAQAELASARGREASGLGRLRRGLSELHAWQSSFGSLDMQTNAAGLGARLAVHGLSVAAGSRSPRVLLEWSERARMLASRVQPVLAPQDEQLVADLTELRALARSEVASSTVAAREVELRRRVRERTWQREGSGQVADPCTLAELQAGLDDSTALVAYVVTADQVVALVVTDTSTHRLELGSRAALDGRLGGLLADLDVAAENLPPGLGELVRGQLVERLSGLADLLVRPLLPHVAARDVVLTPSGVLAGVPWTLLPGLQGRCVTVAQSATSWLARSATPLRSSSVGLVAGPRVERAEAEVRAAAAQWESPRSLVGAAATAAAVSELAAEVDVLHVAAHGRHSSENPLFSGVELVDGAWHGYDIDQLGAVPDVVLLSACEVGRSSVRWGEELIGMTAAWLHAGARCVIASSAAVADEVAHDVLVAFHQALAAGASPAAALAAVVPAATADRPPAPFVCFG